MDGVERIRPRTRAFAHRQIDISLHQGWRGIMIDTERLNKLRTIITENIRVQKGGATPVPYIDVTNALGAIQARQNHVIFGRRGCGKTLLLHNAAKRLPNNVRTVYLSCEDFKKHSFPNVLIEILDVLFSELEGQLTGWFGRKKKSRVLIGEIRKSLSELRKRGDQIEARVRETSTREASTSGGAELDLGGVVDLGGRSARSSRTEVETEYARLDKKAVHLNNWLPELKKRIRDFFELSNNVTTVHIHLDDYYHIRQIDQPHVMDYIHRLCKDLPLWFKVATLRHVSVLYADREGQPTGAQERHDYQPINIDFTFNDFLRTESQVRRIFHGYGELAKIKSDEMNGLFRGEGFRRLVLAGGGVPRDCLSTFLEALDDAQNGDGRIGKDNIRILSLSNLERRIGELKRDSKSSEEDVLLRGIYVIRRFCIDKKNNVFFIPERVMQEDEPIRKLIYRLLDYRIIHSVGTAFTHKTHPGSYQAYMIDIGCYAYMRKLSGRFVEIDLAAPDAKERIRSGPILSAEQMRGFWREAPADVKRALGEEEE